MLRTVITVSAAGPGDAAAIAALLEELDRFYGVTGPWQAGERVRQVSEALFGSPPAAYALLARDGPRPAVTGLAAYSFLWPSLGPARSLYLKELFVSAAHRGQGVGTLLMNAVLDMAARHGCRRVEWTTDPGNTAAQTFYARLGVPQHPKIFYRLEDTGSGFRPGALYR
jgi:GNAT superfamily N-acetyltransferase